MIATAQPLDPQLCQAILAVPGVTRFRPRAGQVLWYQGQVPPGWLVLLQGGLQLCRGRTLGAVTGEVLATHGPLLVVGPAEALHPAKRALRAAERTEVAVVPRSLLLFDRTLQHVAQALGRRRPPQTAAVVRSADTKAGRFGEGEASV